MLTARNADMCSKCLVTEPVVRSFIGPESSRNVSVAQNLIRGVRAGLGLTPACHFN